MKLIKDIRLFELEVPNIDGNPSPYYMGKLYHYDHLECLDVIQRLLFFLRHRGFAFADFDHLYVNFTPCIPHGTVQAANRYNIREFAWHQDVDAGCDIDCFNSWSLVQKTSFVLESIKKAILLKAPEDLKPTVLDTFTEVMEKGDKLLIPYKQKANQKFLVEVLVRIDEEPNFFPTIRVIGIDGTIKVEQSFRAYGRDEFISQIGTITIGKSSVRIAPRKNWYADFYDLQPIKIVW